MKFSINSKYKLWIIITVAILVVGFTLLAIFNFNQTVDFKDSYQVVISSNSQLEVPNQEIKQSAEKYFAQKGIVAVDYATEDIDGPIGKNAVIFKFDKDVNLDKADMKTFIETELDVVGDQMIVINVEYNNVHNYYNSGVGYIVLALAIGGLASFIYLLFAEKMAGAVSVISSAVLSSLLFIALLAITRIPAQPFAPAVCALTFALSMFLSTGFVNRFKEEVRLNDAVESSKDKLSYVQIADKSATDSLYRYAFVGGALLVIALLFVVIGSVYLTFLGLQMIIATLSAVFSSLIGVPLLWPVLKNVKK